MTYFQFLLLFLGIPIVLLAFLMRKRLTKANLILIGILMLVALVYTTPWDNYLVASKVWWYDPALVTGITIGWVPIEEYTFFLLQPVLAGLFALLISGIIPSKPMQSSSSAARVIVTSTLAVMWFAALVVLLMEWMPGNYLALILIWAIPPIALQTAYGADILLHNWRKVLASLVPLIVYLSWADSLAIHAGTWTINPNRTLGIHLGSVLPIEEFIFFVVTNVLIVFSIVLVTSPEGVKRLERVQDILQQRWPNRSPQVASSE